jgi:hypothetical protein
MLMADYWVKIEGKLSFSWSFLGLRLEKGLTCFGRDNRLNGGNTVVQKKQDFQNV